MLAAVLRHPASHPVVRNSLQKFTRDEEAQVIFREFFRVLKQDYGLNHAFHHPEVEIPMEVASGEIQDLGLGRESNTADRASVS